jgi:hypothetical protein
MFIAVAPSYTPKLRRSGMETGAQTIHMPLLTELVGVL